ncbi:hypothetical protein M231_05989 [Tremella mesenterica]|uniref:Trafficking protein particle complex subunit 11 domain-containing protein n=1 Tax=Tremella mesenterica TaxID=5217 RepID=A0A4Q1BGQ2_TREME|nr:hypothetical protein M231_05989 [Tremella mesenterica]
MPPRSVLITYTVHPSPPPPHVISTIQGIKTQLPLRNLHWKSGSRTALRTIQQVDVELVELGEVSSRGKEVNGSVLDNPLVNICMVSCEDAEAYKSYTRSFIRDWLSLLAARRNVHAPLIVLVNPPSSTASAGKNVFGRDKGILGKLKADFNQGKRDRCVQVHIPSGDITDPTTWPEVINKLKESLVIAFDGAILEREEEIRRNDLNRLQPGWNFCTHFLLKESLAHSFEAVNLHEDALIVYEELEAAFFQVLKEQNLSWFGKLGATGPQDDSLPILDTTAKPYRHLLQTSSISIFDFRIYVFARQAALLGKLGRITEIAKRGQWFVASLTRRLRESEGDLAEYFIESWTYTACMDIVHRCDEWSRIDRPNGDYSGLIAYESARSELLDIARVQVERIAVSAGHLPDIYPFSPTQPLVTAQEDVLFESSDAGISDSAQADDHPRPVLSNQPFIEALADETKCRNLYLTLTKKAIMAYEACGKVNSVIRLKADLAALALHTSEWTAAYDLCRDLAMNCAELLIWEKVARYSLDGALRAHRELKRDKDEEWVNLALAYLRVCAGANLTDDVSELGEVLQGLTEVSDERDIPTQKIFSVHLLAQQAKAEKGGDVSFLEVEVISMLPLSVKVADVVLDLTSSHGDEIVFSSGSLDLQPGNNVVKVICNTSVEGAFSLRSSQILLGSISFSQSSPGDVMVHMTRPDGGVKAVIRMPYRIALDEESHLVVEIHSGGCTMRQTRLVLRTGQNDIRLILPNATCDNHRIVLGNQVHLGDVDSQSSLLVSVPYSGVSQGESSRIGLGVFYETPSGEERAYLDEQGVFMGLPLTVNVQDFFRPQCLLSHFTIASDGREYLRIDSVDLSSDPTGGSYEVETRMKKGRWPVVGSSLSFVNTLLIEKTVTPLQSLSTVFKITPKLTTAAHNIIESVLRELTREKTSNQLNFRQHLQNLLSDRTTWIHKYLATGSLADCITSSDPLSIHLRDVLNSYRDENVQWRTLEIPVEVPSRRILVGARYDLIDDLKQDRAQVSEGQALSVKLSLKASFGWAGEVEGDLRMVFDVQASADDWLVLGKKKGHIIFSKDENKPHTASLVLVPMRPGHLFFPHVQTQLSDLKVTEMICETYVENAAESVEVLPARGGVTAVVPLPMWTVPE